MRKDIILSFQLDDGIIDITDPPAVARLAVAMIEQLNKGFGALIEFTAIQGAGDD